MKKFLVFLVLFSLIFFTYKSQYNDNFYSIFDKIEGVEFCYVFSQDNQEKCVNYVNKNQSNEFRTIKTGGHQFIYFNDLVNFKVLANYKQATFFGDENLDKIKNCINYIKVFEENIQNIDIEYGYCPQLNKFVIVNDNKINIQIAKIANKITVGYPMIYGSY